MMNRVLNCPTASWLWGLVLEPQVSVSLWILAPEILAFTQPLRHPKIAQAFLQSFVSLRRPHQSKVFSCDFQRVWRGGSEKPLSTGVGRV